METWKTKQTKIEQEASDPRAQVIIGGFDIYAEFKMSKG